MNRLHETVDVALPPERVFAFATDFSSFPVWQTGVRSARPEDGGQVVEGSTARVERRVGPRLLSTTERVVELTPPRRWVVHGEGGLPVAAVATGVIDPLDGGRRSRVTLALDFEAHGVGRLLLPLVVRPAARRALRRNASMLKDALELGGR
jgi:carbon monoxide dehydrogenase subunit G